MMSRQHRASQVVEPSMARLAQVALPVPLSFIMAVADDHGTVAVRAAHAIRPAMLTHKFKALGLVQQAREIDHLGYRHACAASSNNRITSSSDQIRDLASALPHPEPPPRNPTRATGKNRHVGPESARRRPAGKDSCVVYCRTVNSED